MVVRSPSILIHNGMIIDPSQDLDSQRDLLIEDGRISAIENPGQIPRSRATQTIDAKGQWILPGLIDAHVHLREPGHEYKETIESGTRAATAGGFTSVACMANTAPVNDSPYVTAFIRERSKLYAHCRVFPVGALSKGLKGEELAEIGGMVEEGACAISDDGMPVMNSYLMRKAMDYAKAFDVAVISHAEDIHLVGKGVMNEGVHSNRLGLRGIPAAAEEIMVAREIALCRLTGCRVHIAHISTRAALEHVRRAKEEGLPVTAEVTPHHLLLQDHLLETYDTHFKMAPPLRSAEDNHALQEALQKGWIDMIATDHAPHGINDKNVEFDHAACGILGLQTAAAVTLDLVRKDIVSRRRWVESMTTAPARMLKLPYGTLKKGVEADVTLLNPEAEWVFNPDANHSKSSNSPFMNQTLRGKVTHTLIGGRIVYDSTL